MDRRNQSKGVRKSLTTDKTTAVKTALGKHLEVRLKSRDAQRLKSLKILGLTHKAPLYTHTSLCVRANTPAHNSAELASTRTWLGREIKAWWVLCSSGASSIGDMNILDLLQRGHTALGYTTIYVVSCLPISSLLYFWNTDESFYEEYTYQHIIDRNVCQAVLSSWAQGPREGIEKKGSGHISVSTRELPGSRNKWVLEGHSKKLVMVAPMGRRTGGI